MQKIEATGYFRPFEKYPAAYDGGQIYVSPMLRSNISTVTMNCTVVDPSVDGGEASEFFLTVDVADIDAKTVSESGNADKFLNACLQVVIQHLEGVTANADAEFEIV